MKCGMLLFLRPGTAQVGPGNTSLGHRVAVSCVLEALVPVGIGRDRSLLKRKPYLSTQLERVGWQGRFKLMLILKVLYRRISNWVLVGDDLASERQ